MTAAPVDAIRDAIKSLTTVDLVREVENLQAIREWAITQLGIAEGDHVQIVKPINAEGGWKPYRECLHVGAEGVATRVHFYDGSWRVEFMPDREWTYHETFPGQTGPVRLWHGPVSTCPAGMQVSRYASEDGDNRHVFYLRADKVARIGGTA
jgi:hypothetical protein